MSALPDPHVEIVPAGRHKVELQHEGRTIRTVSVGYASYYARLEAERLRYGLPIERDCLCCGKSFLSAHKLNRLCPYCKAHHA